MLPWISNLARRAFQRFNAERRNDLVHEVIATAYVAFARRRFDQGRGEPVPRVVGPGVATAA
jgi:hypothetical protein